MGAWGNGNLQSDGAQDVLADICDELFDRVVQLLRHPTAHEYDELEFSELLVRLEMIFALDDRGMINTAPNPEDLGALYPPFLKKWADYFTKANRSEPPVEWRNVIEGSFARLTEIAGKACRGSFEHRIELIRNVMSDRPADQSAD